MTSTFAAWRRAAKRIPFLNFVLLHDLRASECEEIAGYYGRQEHRSLKDFLCSLGLRRADGTPKAAWTSLLKGASGLR